MKYRINKFYSLSLSHTVKERYKNTMLKQYKLKLALYILFTVIFIIIAVMPLFFQTKKIHHHLPKRYPTDLKYVLLWKDTKKTKGYLKKGQELLTGQTQFINQNCEYINCYLTYDKNALKGETFDAVVFDVNDVKKMDMEKFNLKRYPEQLYVFKSFESAENHPICEQEFDTFFNWTWTYKLDSDIPQPFIKIYDRNNTLVGPKTNMNWVEYMAVSNKYSKIIDGKTKAVAWVFTKCKLKAKHKDFIDDLTKELRAYNYTVDMFGPCVQKKCPGGRLQNCYKSIETQYFFQLILEESFVEDYASDKLVSAMTHLSVPIIYGLEQYRDFLPPGSYINGRTIDIKKIGAIIDFLIKNREKYEFFFDWKNHYYYNVKPKSEICGLCQKLNEYKGQISTYEHFREWWNPEFKDACQRSKLVKMFNGET